MKKTNKILSVIMVFALLVTSMMISTVSVQAAEDQVVLNWDFSTVEGDIVKDSSGKGNDGYINDGVTIEDGKAVFADGNEGIELPDDIFENAEKITIEMTISPSTFAKYTSLLCVGELNGEWVVIGIMDDGSLRYAVATNGDDNSQSKANSTSASENNEHASFRSEETLKKDAEYDVKYVIEQEETNVYIDGELALTVNTEGKDLIGDIGGPVVLGKATKWTADPSYRGTISSVKISVPATEEAPATEAPADPTVEATATPDATEEATATPEATEEATATPKATTAKPSATKAPTSTTPATVADNNGDSGMIWIIVAIAAVVVVAVVVVIIVMKKKKK